MNLLNKVPSSVRANMKVRFILSSDCTINQSHLQRVSFPCLFSGYGGGGGGTGVGLLAAGTVIAPLAALIAPLAALALLGSATLVAINPTLVQLAVIGRKKRDASRLGFVKG